MSSPVLPSSSAVAASTFAKVEPKEFHRKFLQHKVRPDGRTLQTVRPIIIAPDSLTNCPGSSLVKIGSTSVVCAIKLEVGRPFDTKPQDGRLAVEVHLGPICSSKFKVGRATEQAVVLSQWLTNAIINSHTLHLPDLSIVSGESSWVLYADIVCLNYDGNLYDACLLALVESLKRLQLPETEVIEDGVGDKRQSEVCISTANHHPLPIKHLLIPTTFGLFDQQLIVDPNSQEEDLLSGQVTIVLNEESQVCQIHKAGGVPMSDAQLQECIAIAKSRVPIVLPMIK